MINRNQLDIIEDINQAGSRGNFKKRYILIINRSICSELKCVICSNILRLSEHFSFSI